MKAEPRPGLSEMLVDLPNTEGLSRGGNVGPSWGLNPWRPKIHENDSVLYATVGSHGQGEEGRAPI